MFSSIMCIAMITAEIITKDTSFLIAAGLFAIAAEINFKKKERRVKNEIPDEHGSCDY